MRYNIFLNIFQIETIPAQLSAYPLPTYVKMRTALLKTIYKKIWLRGKSMFLSLLYTLSNNTENTVLITYPCHHLSKRVSGNIDRLIWDQVHTAGRGCAHDTLGSQCHWKCMFTELNLSYCCSKSLSSGGWITETFPRLNYYISVDKNFLR